MTDFTATILIVVVDLQQLHIKVPIRSSIVSAKVLLGTEPKGKQVLQQDLSLLFFELTSLKVEGRVSIRKLCEALGLGFSFSTTLFK